MLPTSGMNSLETGEAYGPSGSNGEGISKYQVEKYSW